MDINSGMIGRFAESEPSYLKRYPPFFVLTRLLDVQLITEVPDTLLFEFTIDMLKVIQGSLFRVIFVAVKNQLRDNCWEGDYVNQNSNSQQL